MIHRFSVNKDIKNFKKDLIKECIDQRKKETGGCNFQLQTKYLDNLYKLFINCAQKILNPFTLTDKNFKVWCYMTDSVFNDTNWHNHEQSATINSVIYLQVKDKGIRFKHENKQIYIQPDDGDMLIFPSFLDHQPDVSTDDKRISLNLELRCNENEKEIFDISI